MKRSLIALLRSIFAITILLGMRGGWQNSLRAEMIPVVVHTNTYGLGFNDPPAEIRIDESVDAVDRLKKAIADQHPQPVSESTVGDLIAEPEKFNLSKDVLQQRISDFDSIGSTLVPLLSDETIDSEKRFHFARILTTLGVRAGFDWGIDRFSVHDEWDDGGIKQLLFYTASKAWLEEVDVWSLLQPRLGQKKYGDRSAGEYFCPEQMMAWYIAECENPETSDAARQEYFRALAGFAPTLDALKSCDSLFKAGPEKFEDWTAEPELADLLQQFVDGNSSSRAQFVRDESEVEEMKSIACQLAKRVAGHRHGTSQMYHRFICANGDEEYREYFENNLGKSYYQYHAFEALVRLEGDDATEFLRRHADGFPGQEKYLQDQATTMLAERLSDAVDPDFVDSLAGSFHAAEKWDKKLSIVNRLFQAGAIELAEEFRRDVATNAPDVYYRRPLSRKWNENGRDIHQLLSDLQSFGYAKSLTVAQINQASMPFGPSSELPHASMVSHAEHAFKALELSGLRESVDVLTELETKLQGLSKMAGGEFDVDLIHVDVEAKTTTFRYRNQVFCYDVDSPEEYQDPIVLTMIANSLLKRSEVTNRFLTFDDFDGMTDISFFYGSPALAKLLTQKYDIPFLAGSSAYYEAD